MSLAMLIAAAMLGAWPTPALAATAPSLGSAANFAVLSAAPSSGGAVTCTNGTITGDVGSSGAAASVVQTTCTISGSIIAPVAAQVVTDFNSAYGAYAAIPCDSVLTGTLASVTLAPGVYCFDAAAALTGTLTLDGPSTGTWIFKIGTSGTGALTGTGFSVVMAGGGLPCNVNWQVAQGATMTDSNFIGTILGGADITLTRGTFVGNALATAGWTTTGTNLTGCPPPPPAVIAITKTADAASVSAGTAIGFTVTLSNTGGSTATGVTLTDALPAGNLLTPVHWSIDGSTGDPAAFSISGVDGSQSLSLAGQPVSLAGGASLTVHVTAPTTAQNCASYNNTAGVTTSNAGSGSASASETVLCAAVTILKTADAGTVNAGDPIGFTVLVGNPGTGTANGVTVSDPLPAGSGAGLSWSIDSQSNPGLCSINSPTAPQTLSCGPTTLASLASFSVHITATTSAGECTLYANTATATTTNDGGGSSQAQITCNPADVTILKTADAASVSAGTPIGFTVMLLNTGAGTAKGVMVTDPLPAGSASGVSWSIDNQSNPGLCSISGSKPSQVLSCGPIDLASGGNFSVHITATTSATECTLYANTATATTTNDGGGGSQAQITCNPADVTILKTADAASVSAGTPIGFTVMLLNTGAGTATGVTLSDALPGGNLLTPVHWSIDGSTGNPAAFSLSGVDGSQSLSLAGQPISLAPGASLSVHVRATTTAQNCASYNNTAGVSTSNDGSGSASAAETVLCASINISKTADAATVNAGDPIGFTVTLLKSGAGTANGVIVNDPLPAGSGAGLSWSIDSQSNPGLCSINSPTAPQTLSCGPIDLASGGSSQATITCNPANVTILKTADAATVNAGDPIGFTVLVGNPGTGTANGVMVSDALPAGSGAGLSWSINSQSNAGLCSISGSKPSQVLSCGPIDLPSGGSFSVHITATTSAGECTLYANTATATTTNDGGGSTQAQITCNPGPDPALPGLPNTSAPDLNAGGPGPNEPEKTTGLVLAILALLAGLGVLALAGIGQRRNRARVGQRRSRRRQRQNPGGLAIGLLAVVLSLAVSSFSLGELAPTSSRQTALAPVTQLIGSQVVSVVPPAAPQGETFHRVAGPITPSRLRIPSIGVDTSIGAVGLRADGSMDVPDNLWTSSWLASGPRPGDAGNAVIAGHRGVGSPALFSHLENLRPGDRIYVSDTAGNEVVFVVTRVASLDLSRSTQVAVFGPAPAEQVVLITCFGHYIQSAGTYDHRLVVFSRLLPLPH